MVVTAPVAETAEPFPAEFERDVGSSGGTLENEMIGELRNSWEAYHQMTVATAVTTDATPERFMQLRNEVQRRLADVSAWLWSKLDGEAEGRHATGWSLRKAAALVAQACVADMLEAAGRPDVIRAHNPFLSRAAVDNVHRALLLWMQLCVLDDKLQRLITSSAASQVPQLIQELSVTRVWDVRQHPLWLTLEVEAGLQIRPAQYVVARHLIDHPGAIVQLSMGEGKTRVIVPMLALHWASSGRVVRLTFLPTLLHEAYDHLHAHLCASVLARKLYLLPFSRDVQLDRTHALAMRDCLAQCSRGGGLLLVAREHLLSLLLKAREIRDAGDDDVWRVLHEFEALPYIDVLDESDALLWHKYQLIYARGASEALPDGANRWFAIQAVLLIIKQSREVAGIISNPDVAVRAALDEAAALQPLRLLPGPQLERALEQLRVAIARELCRSPPYEFAWLAQHAQRDDFVRFMTDATAPADSAVPLADLTEKQKADLLALRSLLACNVLFHCLQRRHRVDYGIKRDPPAKKRLAVPFRASDTPADRDEFAQPDIALVFTHLSYYYDGLTQAEVNAALRQLLNMSEGAQADFYDAWYRLSEPDIAAPEHRAKLDSVRKLDLTNARQVELVWRYFGRNVLVVNFWLCFCVLPTDTLQFPQRLGASAWHLSYSEAGRVVGFSGTNDGHLLLPLHVSQHRVTAESLHATNGRMLRVIARNPTYTTLAPDASKPQWQRTLDCAVERGAHALIDAGAMLAPASNLDAARHVLESSEFPPAFRGVVFFDTRANPPCWAVIDRLGRRSPLERSAIPAGDAFVIFDESRCRGADLKLRADAVAMLTLGPNMPKDKLMQAAGRMRGLERGQTVQFLGASDVTAKIADVNGTRAGELTSLHVLVWAVRNSQRATSAGLADWAHQGLQFAAELGFPERAVQSEQLGLEELYAGATERKLAAEVIEASAGRTTRAFGGTFTSTGKSIIERVLQRAARYGGDVHVLTRGLDEECERELEEEEEQEEEQERQVLAVSPLAEEDWPYESVCTAKTIAELPVQTHSLGEALRGVEHGAADLLWPAAVRCTRNFCHGTDVPGGEDYLRPVNWLLMFHYGEILLLSEREADRLLSTLWPKRSAAAHASGAASSASFAGTSGRSAGASAPPPSILCQLTYLRSAADAGETSCTLAVPSKAFQVSDRLLAAVQLFAGETRYVGAERQRAAEELIRGRECAAAHIVFVRGLRKLYPRSDLERMIQALEGGRVVAAPDEGSQ